MSETINQYVAQLAAGEASYSPNDEVQQSLREKTFIGIVGPLAIGKTTVIQTVSALHPAFHEVQGYTTRPPRPGEQLGEFREFWPHNEASLAAIHARKSKDELVQYAVHPKTGHIYATELEDYGPLFNLLPVLPANLVQFENIPFKSKLVASLVCLPHEWQRRLTERTKTMDATDVKKRLVEASENLSWSLERPDTVWIKNRQNKAQEAARKIIAVASGADTNISNHRKTGEKLLRHITTILETY